MQHDSEERPEWIAGTNMPGYMPDSEPAGFETFDEARAYIKGELESDMEANAQGEADRTLDDDLASAWSRVDTWRPEASQSTTAGNRAYWIERAEA